MKNRLQYVASFLLIAVVAAIYWIGEYHPGITRRFNAWIEHINSNQ